MSYVCGICKDTHQMQIGDSNYGDDRMVMCTHCPRPCQKCRQGGTGAFCTNTPCSCHCHPRPVLGTWDDQVYFAEEIEPLIRRVAQLCTARDIPILIRAQVSEGTTEEGPRMFSARVRSVHECEPMSALMELANPEIQVTLATEEQLRALQRPPTNIIDSVVPAPPSRGYKPD